MRMHNDNLTTNQVMRQVIYALMLGVVAHFYFYGFGVVVQIFLAVLTAITAEALILKIRKIPIAPSISDGSAILSAVLLAIAIPSIAPWWIIVVGVGFAIVFGKQLYGGLGNNPFNPAMLGYAFLLISYPLQMTLWQSSFIDLSTSFDIIFNYANIDGYTGATRLDDIKTSIALGKSFSEINIASIEALVINIAFLLGGLYLLARKVIFWHIPVSFLAGIAIISSLLYLTDSSVYLAPNSHLLLGGTMLGAFFIATDPVTAATTKKGRIIYGLLIGVLIVVIRTFGGYPDAIAFSILLMNITTPLIDYYTRDRVFGR